MAARVKIKKPEHQSLMQGGKLHYPATVLCCTVLHMYMDCNVGHSRRLSQATAERMQILKPIKTWNETQDSGSDLHVRSTQEKKEFPRILWGIFFSSKGKS